MISNNLISSCWQNSNFTENEIGEKIFKIAEIFYQKLIDLNSQFKKMCQTGLKKSAFIIVNDNSDFDKEEFFEYCESTVKKVFGEEFDLTEENIQKLNNDEKVISLKDLKRQCKTLMGIFLETIAERFGVKILSHSFRIDEVDVKKHFMLPYIRKSKESIFDCFYYMLYTMKEPKFEKWLKKVNSELPTKKIFENLIRNSSFVNGSTKPEKGDMIIYLDEEMKPLHFGILSDSNTVQSKWGSLPQIFSHPIHISPYGSSYWIFRKNK